MVLGGLVEGVWIRILQSQLFEEGQVESQGSSMPRVFRRMSRGPLGDLPLCRVSESLFHRCVSKLAESSCQKGAGCEIGGFDDFSVYQSPREREGHANFREKSGDGPSKRWRVGLIRYAAKRFTGEQKTFVPGKKEKRLN